MSVLIDISHPAHVHFFRPLALALIADGVSVHIATRDKDVTVRLLEASGLPFKVLPMGRPGAGRLSGAAELLRRSWALRRRIRRHKVSVVLTRNPSGAIAAFATRATSIFDTDDGRGVGIHYWAARPFADIITSSVHDPENHGRGHRRYRALKAHMFLHPDRFTPDRALRRKYLSDDEQFGVVRFSAHDASHDRRIEGITSEGRRAIMERLLQFGPVLVSIERQGLQLQRDKNRITPVAPEDFHHLLAAASLFVGDSQSVAADAAILGVPSLRLSGFTGTAFYLQHLEGLGLIQNFSPGEEDDLLEALESFPQTIVEEGNRSREIASVLNDGACDLPDWYVSLTKSHLSRSDPTEGSRN